MSLDALDQILTGGGATFKFENPGDTITGTITGIQVRQSNDFDTGKPAFWDNGDPKQQVVVTLATDIRDPNNSDDDGERNVYIKGWGGQRQSFIAAVKEAGSKPKAGDTFTATYTGDGEKPQRGFAPKLFKYTVEPSGIDALDALGATPEAAPQQAAPTTQPAPQQPAQASAQAPTGGQDGGDVAKAQQLIALGLTDDQIASATNLPAEVVTALRAAA